MSLPIPSEPEARVALDALPGLAWRPLGRGDLEAAAAVFAASEAHDANPDRQSLTGLQEFWDADRSRPEDDVLLARDEAGEGVAVAWAGCNRAITERRGARLNGAVRPDRRGEGIGRAVLTWGLAHVLAWDAASREDGFGPLVVRLWAPTAQDDVRDLATRFGLEVERFFVEMTRPLTDADRAEVVVPDGIRLTGWDDARSSEVHRVVDTAFRDHWGHVDSTPEMWTESITSAVFRPQWTVLAVDTATDAVVGVALNTAYEQDWAAEGRREGYTDDLAVLRSHRGRGIASALLRESMRRFAIDGLDAAGLGVDVANPSGALGLYEGLGYAATAGTCVHERVWPDGA